MSYIRTPEHRVLRRNLIQLAKPWEKSTGPKTTEGKAKVAKNGFKGAQREAMRTLARLLREQQKLLEEVSQLP